MGDLTIKLSRRYGETSKPFDALAFRSPLWADFIELGDIEEWQPMGTGEGDVRMILVRHHDVVAQYAERCVKEPNSSADLTVLDLADTMAVHEGIRGFFAKARPSRKAPTGSSGSSAKASTKPGD